MCQTSEKQSCMRATHNLHMYIGCDSHRQPYEVSLLLIAHEMHYSSSYKAGSPCVFRPRQDMATTPIGCLRNEWIASIQPPGLMKMSAGCKPTLDCQWKRQVFPGLAKLWSQHRPPPPKPPVLVNCTLQANHCVWTIADGLVSGWCQNEGADASRTAAGIRVGTLLRPLSRVDSRGSPYSFSSDAVNVTDIIRLCTRRLAVLSSKG